MHALFAFVSTSSVTLYRQTRVKVIHCATSMSQKDTRAIQNDPEGALQPGQNDTLLEPEESKALAIPEITNPTELAAFARKSLLPIAIQTYVRIIQNSKDEKMVKASADAIVDLANVKQKESSTGPAFVLNLGQDFLNNLKGGMERVVHGATTTPETLKDR